MRNIYQKVLAIGLAFFVLLFAAPEGAWAVVFNVPAGNVNALKRAIRNANATGTPDTIRLAPGNYTLTEDDVGSRLTGLPSILTDITINGASLATSGAIRTIIERDPKLDEASFPAFRLFRVAPTGSLTLRRVRVQNGFVQGNGGAILNAGGTLRLFNSIVTESRASPDDGGGGGIFVTGTTDSATGTENTGTAVLVDSTVSDNTSEEEGAGILIASGGILRLIRSTVSGNENSAEGGGGGISIEPNGRLVAVNSTISRNVALAGGESGGGISNAGTANLRFVTITRNEGLGIVNGGTVKLRHTILAGNTAENDKGKPVAADCDGKLNFVREDGELKSMPGGFNLLGVQGVVAGLNFPPENRANCIFEVTSTDVAGKASNPRNPRLRALADNGGFTLTHALRPNSRAIDAGSNACPPPGVDQRRVRRPKDGDEDDIPLCDIGAFEFDPR